MAKDRATLEAAYDDAQGVTAQFNGNLLRRINRELGADFDLDQFRHHAVYRPELGRVEMHLESLRDTKTVPVPGAKRLPASPPPSGSTPKTRTNTPRFPSTASHSKPALPKKPTWTDRLQRFRVQRWRVRTTVPL